MVPVVHAEGLGKRYQLGNSIGGYDWARVPGAPPPPPGSTPTISVADATAIEGTGHLSFSITLSEPSVATEMVDWYADHPDVVPDSKSPLVRRFVPAAFAAVPPTTTRAAIPTRHSNPFRPYGTLFISTPCRPTIPRTAATAPESP